MGKELEADSLESNVTPELVGQVLTVCVFVYHCISFSDNDRKDN